MHQFEQVHKLSTVQYREAGGGLLCRVDALVWVA